ncbi:hypothetical protein, partial [Roseibium sp. RKSG952]|uniref:hypothetical protein n=1 Tax=Roseibium sp. RKSG952 TaxID=2529384 RepID=UPI001AD94935
RFTGLLAWKKALHPKPCINSCLEALSQDHPASIYTPTVAPIEELTIDSQGYFITISTQPFVNS